MQKPRSESKQKMPKMGSQSRSEPHKQRSPTCYCLLLCRPGHRRPWPVAVAALWPMPALLSRPVAAPAAVFKMDNIPPARARPLLHFYQAAPPMAPLQAPLQTGSLLSLESQQRAGVVPMAGAPFSPRSSTSPWDPPSPPCSGIDTARDTTSSSLLLFT